MSCFHPLKAFYSLQSDGKKKITFYNETKFNKPYESYPDDFKLDIPCGQCSGCRLEYARQWATRCVLEAMQYEENYFITLTYNDESLFKNCLRKNACSDKDTGEVLDFYESFSLCPDNLKKFLKDLRRYFSYHFDFDGIRFFACGEYGDKKQRPHFHVVLFNCPLSNFDDLKYFGQNRRGDIYYISDTLTKIWNKGHVLIGECNFETCSYVARYMMKKQKGATASFYEDNGVIPPFTRSSRMPGIAKSFYDKNSNKIYYTDSIVITGANGEALKVRPPSYFDRLYDVDNPDDLKRVKNKRKESAENIIRIKLKNTNKSKDELLDAAEYNFNSKIITLIRSLD